MLSQRLHLIIKPKVTISLVSILLDLVNTHSEFEAQGVKFIATRDQVDMTTPAGRMFDQILGSLGEFERALIRERIILGLDFARSRGKHLGRPNVKDDQAVRELWRPCLSYQLIQRRLVVSKDVVCRALTGLSKKPGNNKPVERRSQSK